MTIFSGFYVAQYKWQSAKGERQSVFSEVYDFPLGHEGGGKLIRVSEVCAIAKACGVQYSRRCQYNRW